MQEHVKNAFLCKGYGTSALTQEEIRTPPSKRKKESEVKLEDGIKGKKITI